MSDDAFNKNTVFAEQGGIEKTPIRNDNFGFTLGGPIRRNKTHFFTNIDYTRIRSGTIAGFGNTTPVDAFKNGNFGALLTNNRIGTDALGRPIMQGQIFDPQTTRHGQRHPGARPIPGQRHSRQSPAAQRRRLADRAADGGARPRRAGQQRRRHRHRRPDLGAGRAEHHGPRRSQLLAGLQVEHAASIGIAVRRCGTARAWTGATTTPIPRRRRPRTPTTTAAGSSSASPRTMRTSSSTGSSATTC